MTNEAVITCQVVEHNYHKLMELISLVGNDMDTIKFEFIHSQAPADLNHLKFLRDRINLNNSKCRLHLNIICINPELMYETASKLKIPFIYNAIEEIKRTLDLTDLFVSYLDSIIKGLDENASV